MMPLGRFDLVEEIQRMRSSRLASGHVAKTLVRSSDVRLVLMVLRRDAQIPVHHAEGALTIHGLEGRVHIEVAETVFALAPGHLLVLEPGVPHALRAIEDCAILLAVAWRGPVPGASVDQAPTRSSSARRTARNASDTAT